jgi:hypothetical protein
MRRAWTRIHSGARLPACTPDVLGAALPGGSTKAELLGDLFAARCSSKGHNLGRLSAS